MIRFWEADGRWSEPGTGEVLPDLQVDPTDAALFLHLQPHPEGGFFRETYRSPNRVSTPWGWRSYLTCALFMVTADSPSHWHQLLADETWFYQAGAPVEHYSLTEGGRLQKVVLGPHHLNYQEVGMDTSEWLAPRVHVPPSAWQAARLVPYTDEASSAPVSWGLVACIVAPGFDFADFKSATRSEFLSRHGERFRGASALLDLLPGR